LECKEHGYKGVYLLSREPLVVYIEGFLGEGEGDEVVKLRYVRADAHLASPVYKS
jgi:prolyl 4-hydroxylase